MIGGFAVARCPALLTLLYEGHVVFQDSRPVTGPPGQVNSG